ncbi:hypothetical protein JCM8202_002620, partial [Rhodotorula sphaerocarpa]
HDKPSQDLARLSWEVHNALAAELDGPNAYGWRECAAVGLAVGGHGESRSKYRSLPGAAAHRDTAARRDWLEGDREDLSTEGGVAQIDPADFCKHLHSHLERVYPDRFRTVFGRATSIRPPSRAGEKKSLELARVAEGANAPRSLPFDRLLIACGPWSAAVCETLKLPPLPLTNLPGHSLLIRPASGAHTVDLPSEAVFAGIDGSVGGVHASTSGLARGLTDEEKAEGYTRSPELFVRRTRRGETRELIYVAGENSIPETPKRGGSTAAAGAGVSLAVPPLPNRLPQSVDEVRDLLDERLIGRLKRAAGAVSPLLKEENGATIERQQFCYRPISSDREPILGPLQLPDVFVATGHGPWGICLSAGTGRVMAEFLLDRPPSADVRGLSVVRFNHQERAAKL